MTLPVRDGVQKMSPHIHTIWCRKKWYNNDDIAYRVLVEMMQWCIYRVQVEMKEWCNYLSEVSLVEMDYEQSQQQCSEHICRYEGNDFNMIFLYFGKNSQFNSVLFRKDVLNCHYIYMVSPKITPQWQIGYMVKYPKKSRDVLCALFLICFRNDMTREVYWKCIKEQLGPSEYTDSSTMLKN